MLNASAAERMRQEAEQHARSAEREARRQAMYGRSNHADAFAGGARMPCGCTACIESGASGDRFVGV